MATLRNFGGFETEDNSEIIFTAGSPSVSTAAPVRTGTASLKLVGNATQAIAAMTTQYNATTGDETNNADTYYCMGFAIRFSDLSPGTRYSFMSARDSASSYLLFINLETNGDVIIENISGTDLATVTAPFTVDTWHYVEFQFRNVDSAPWEFYIDGVSKASGTGADFKGPFSATLTSFGVGGPLGAGDGTVYVDDYYLLSDAASLPTPLGTIGKFPEVFAYQGAKNSATPDSGDDLDVGTWDLAAEAPLDGTAGNLITYTLDSGDGYVNFDDAAMAGHGGGPSGGIYAVGGTIHGAKWFGNYSEEAAGTGNQVMTYGHSGDVADLGDMLLGTSFNAVTGWRGVVLASTDSKVPTASEVFAMGFKTTGTKGMTCYEQFAFLLHVPNRSLVIPSRLPRRSQHRR